MQFTLIAKNGKIMQFYLEAVANLYQQLHGGVVITQQVFEPAVTAQN